MTSLRNNAAAAHAPLHPEDTVEHTIGCRHTEPVVCGKNCMPNVCAFVRQDGMCLSPPMSWSRQFKKLKPNGTKT